MKRKILNIILMCSLFVLISGCTNQSVNNNKVKINVAGLQGPTTIGMIKMFEEKPVITDNTDVSYKVVKTPDFVVSKLISKEIDIAAVPTNLAAKLYNKGIDCKLAAMNTWGVLYLVGKDASIKKWSDLRGKTIYLVGKGTTPDFIIRYILKSNNLNPDKDVKLDFTVGQAELAQGIIAGKYKIALLPEPFATMALMKNKDTRIIFDLQKEWESKVGKEIPFAQTCLLIRGEVLRNNKEFVDKFLARYKESIDWVNKNPKEAGILVEKQGIGMKAKVAELAIPRCNIRYEGAQGSKAKVQAFLKKVFEFSPSDIGGKVPDEGFYYSE